MKEIIQIMVSQMKALSTCICISYLITEAHLTEPELCDTIRVWTQMGLAPVYLIYDVISEVN